MHMCDIARMKILDLSNTAPCIIRTDNVTQVIISR